MSWTTKYPTSPGLYWIRNYQFHTQSYQQATIIDIYEEKGTLSGVPELRFFFFGDDMFYPLTTIVSAEWQGPIEPEVEKPNRVEFRPFPRLACSTCGNVGNSFISWPTQAADGPHAHRHYSLICRECWIAVLTPEQRWAYKV